MVASDQNHPPVKTPPIRSCLIFVLAIAGTVRGADAGLPASQPKMLNIIRESVKVGRGADHARHEAGWPAAYEKANSPDYYLALTSMTGPSEAWYLAPFESHAAIAAMMKREEKDPVLAAELGRLGEKDAEYLEGWRAVQTKARPDLSFGQYPNIAKARFFEITILTVRPGKYALFESILKAYNAARQRVAPESSYRIYAAIAGTVGATYYIIQSVEDYAHFDRTGDEHRKTFAAATPEETALFDKWGDAVVREETQRFRLDPKQSYVSKEARASDPEFWNGK